MVSSPYFIKQSSFYVFRDRNYCCESSRLLDLPPLISISWQNLHGCSYQLTGLVLFSGTYVSHRSSTFNLKRCKIRLSPPMHQILRSLKSYKQNQTKNSSIYWDQPSHESFLFWKYLTFDSRNWFQWRNPFTSDITLIHFYYIKLYIYILNTSCASTGYYSLCEHQVSTYTVNYFFY